MMLFLLTVDSCSVLERFPYSGAALQLLRSAVQVPHGIRTDHPDRTPSVPWHWLLVRLAAV